MEDRTTCNFNGQVQNLESGSPVDFDLLAFQFMGTSEEQKEKKQRKIMKSFNIIFVQNIVEENKKKKKDTYFRFCFYGMRLYNRYPKQ